MMRLVVRNGLPLLARELREQAAKKRTYFFRIAFALALYAIVYERYSVIIPQNAIDQFAALGYGKNLFSPIVDSLALGIFVFMPAITCGAIAAEKERGTLGVLLLTRLSPMTILFEKLLSRLIPMFTFLLLSMPLMAFAYSLGGVDQTQLWSSIWLLGLTCVQVGSFSLMCSAYASSTISAFFMSYILGVLVQGVCGSCICPLSGIGIGLNHVAQISMVTVVHSVFLIASSMVFLAIAKNALVTRALVTPRNFLLEIFRRLDRFYNELNVVTGGMVLARDRQLLPGDEPLAWRETSKKSLGTARYLFRVLTTIETPLLCVLVLHDGPRRGFNQEISLMLLSIVAHVAVLLVAAKSASLVSGERSRQTFDVLLTTPLTGREILAQQFRGVARLLAVLSVPFLTILGFELYWQTGYLGWNKLLDSDSLIYIFRAGLLMLIYLPLVAWISYWIGLKIQRQSRAIIVSLLVIFAWIYLPSFAQSGNSSLAAVVRTLSPAWMIVISDWEQAGTFGALLHCFFYGGLLWFVRSWCLNRADLLLGRSGPATGWVASLTRRHATVGAPA